MYTFSDALVTLKLICLFWGGRPVNRGEHIHPTYLALSEVTLYVNWCVVALCTQNVCRDGISFTWHQPCNNKTALQVHHFGGYLKRAIKGYNYSLRIECDKNAESVQDSRERRFIKALNQSYGGELWP